MHADGTGAIARRPRYPFFWEGAGTIPNRLQVLPKRRAGSLVIKFVPVGESHPEGSHQGSIISIPTLSAAFRSFASPVAIGRPRATARLR